MLAALLLPATAIAGAQQKAPAQQKIGAKMLKPLKAAQESIAAKNWDAALASLAEAQAMGRRLLPELCDLGIAHGWFDHYASCLARCGSVERKLIPSLWSASALTG